MPGSTSRRRCTDAIAGDGAGLGDLGAGHGRFYDSWCLVRAPSTCVRLLGPRAAADPDTLACS